MPLRHSCRSCFNSATALKPWRTSNPFLFLERAIELQFGHGVEAVENLIVTLTSRATLACFNSATALKPWRTPPPFDPDWSWRSCFNSATALKPWRTFLIRVTPDEFTELQFGHGVEAVENSNYTGFIWRGIYELQFGHGVEAVENHYARRRHGRRGLGFNSATALKPWRTCLVGEGHTTLASLQFGHGVEAVENDYVHHST